MLIRKATMADVPAIHRLVNAYAQEGLMLRRPLVLLYESVRDLAVAIGEDGNLLGCGALHVLWHDLAEVRSLAVDRAVKGQGVGRAVVQFLVDEAVQLGLKRVFALTYQEEFFARCGFVRLPKERLPQKVWKECIYCDKFHQCDEIAVIRYLVPSGQLDEVTGVSDPAVDMPLWVIR